ncbi:lipopolysaccharide biosynthesis protein [Niabella defluvii]|nr:lipopolysaccharide biosynthesis protein [Niabella sp. I65]
MQDKVEFSGEKNEGQEVTSKELIFNVYDWGRYLLSKWYIVLLFGLLGAALGLAYAFSKKKKTYTATTSFVLETGKSGGLASYAGIASSLGIDLGGAGGGLFDGDNIIELYKSRNMISQALLTEADFGGNRQLLIDRYIEFNKLRDSWTKSNPELKMIHFRSDNIYTNPKLQLLHDSIMGQIVKGISDASLKVEKRDKKLNIIYVVVQSGDELFAKALNESLVQKVNRFYLDTKTTRNLENVAILQAKTDSVRGIMTGAINRAAAVADATPNQNPTRMAQRVAPMQNEKVKAEVNQEVLKSLLQNLELSKISLLKETP